MHGKLFFNKFYEMKGAYFFEKFLHESFSLVISVLKSLFALSAKPASSTWSVRHTQISIELRTLKQTSFKILAREIRRVEWTDLIDIFNICAKRA